MLTNRAFLPKCLTVLAPGPIICDLNGDGHPELVVGGSGTTNRLWILYMNWTSDIVLGYQSFTDTDIWNNGLSSLPSTQRPSSSSAFGTNGDAFASLATLGYDSCGAGGVSYIAFGSPRVEEANVCGGRWYGHYC
jgi:hypothetical protein